MWLVETNRDSVLIEDLGILVTRSEPQLISDKDKEGSLCLKQLWKLGSLRVSSHNPSRVTSVVENKYPPPSVKMTRPNRGGMKPLPDQPEVPEPRDGRIHLTPQELSEIINKAALKGAHEALRAFEERRSPVVAPPVVNVSAPSAEALEVLVAKIAETLGKPGAAVKVIDKDVGLVDPVFIPEGIVKDDALEISKEDSSGAGLDEAAAALKSLKKRKKNASSEDH